VSVCADHTEDGLEEDARRRAQEIATGEDTAARAAAEDEQALSPDAEIAQLPSTGRQLHLTDTAGYQRLRHTGRIRGPRR